LTEGEPIVRGTHILVVDDDQGVRVGVSRLLRASGFHPFAAASGPEALAYLAGLAAHELPAMIIMDLMMPGMTGLELADEVARGWPDLPVLFVSAHTDHPMRRSVVESGRRFLAKPFAADALLDAVAGIVQGREVDPPGARASPRRPDGTDQ